MKNLLLFSCLFVLAFSSCEKEEFVPLADNGLDTAVTPRADDCDFNESTNQIIIFDICGAELVFQGELHLMNNGNIHQIQALGKCHKLDNPDAPVNVTEISVEIWGEASIWCTIPIDISVPSDYNTNLVNGQVPSAGNCHNCHKELINIEYAKHITLADDDFIKAKIRLKAEFCGEFFEETMTLNL